MDLWEYFCISFNARGGVDLDEYSEELNKMGRKGWELISCVPIQQEMGATKEVTATFKRLIIGKWALKGNQE